MILSMPACIYYNKMNKSVTSLVRLHGKFVETGDDIG